MLTRLELRFERMDVAEAARIQYELLKRRNVWRAFINGPAGRGFVVFEGEIELPGNFEVIGERKLTLEELIELSLSERNVLQ